MYDTQSSKFIAYAISQRALRMTSFLMTLVYMWHVIKQAIGKHIESQRQKTYLRTGAQGEVLDQPAHSHNMFRIFAECILDRQGCKFSSCVQRRL